MIRSLRNVAAFPSTTRGFVLLAFFAMGFLGVGSESSFFVDGLGVRLLGVDICSQGAAVFKDQWTVQTV